MSANRFGWQLRTLRKAADLTQKQLGKKCGVSQVRICNIERGTYQHHTIKTLSKLAKALDYKLTVKFERPKNG